MVLNIKTYFSKTETLWGEKFCTYPRQNIFQILSPLKDAVLDLDPMVCALGGGRGQFSPFAS